MQASGFREARWTYSAKQARLNIDGIRRGWCAKSANGNQDWLKIDLGITYDICGVATQGNANNTAEYTRDFKLSLSSDESGWTVCKDTNNSDVVIIDAKVILDFQDTPWQRRVR